MKHNTILACLALAAGIAHAQVPAPSVIGLHLHSVHATHGGSTSPDDLGWNNRNVGAYARWDNGFTVGAFRNSLHRKSAYIGWTLTDGDDRFAITLGAVSGYDKVVADGTGDHQAVRCDAEHGCRMVSLKRTILPLIVPSVRLPITNQLSARVALLAPARKPAAVHFALEWKL
jgi:hypothetical protein